ncbi:Chitin synthase [Ordospora colligata]
MLMFFYLYFGAMAIEAFLVGFGYSTSQQVHLFLTTLQVSLYTSAFFVLFLGCITIDMFMGVFGIRVTTLLRGTTALYSIGMGAMVFIGLSSSNKQIASIPLIVLNMLFFSLYVLLQLKKLKKRNGEVWAFGTLFISLSCFIIANVFLFVGSAIIGIATNRYFDNLFFYHFFILCTFIMVHKYWLSVYDYEVESLRLET